MTVKDKHSDGAVEEFVWAWATRGGKAEPAEVVERTGKLFTLMRGYISEQRSAAMVKTVEEYGSIRRAANALDLSLQTVNKIIKRGQPTREELLAEAEQEELVIETFAS